MIDLTALTAEVADTEGIEQSAIAVINGFAAEIKDAVAKAIAADGFANDATNQTVQASIDAVVARFKNASASLATAITAVPTGDPASTPAVPAAPDAAPTGGASTPSA